MRNKKWIIGAIVAIILVLAIAGTAFAATGPYGQAPQTTNTTCLGAAACPAVDGSGTCVPAAVQGLCPRAAGGCCGR
jgi:ABC-type phosphate transport system substrate-binding protein